MSVNGAELMNRLCKLRPGHFRAAIDDFIKAEYLWKGHLQEMITAEFDYKDSRESLRTRTKRR